MIVERIEIAKLIADPSNARTHPERNLATIVGSLHRFGQQKPIVIDKANVVRAGNGTLEAARSLGWTHLDCVRTELDGSDATAYAIADNRTSELAEWDDDVLVALLESLQSDDEALLEAAGFTDEELSELRDEESEEDAERAGEIAKALQLVPDKEYIVIMCETADDWEEMKEQLNLPQVRRGGYKSGSAFDSIGTQRVLQWAELRSMLADDICDTIEG